MNIYKNIFISILDGRTVRDLFQNDIIKFLNDEYLCPVILSEANNIEKFTSFWQNNNTIIFERYLKISPTFKRHKSSLIRRYIASNFNFLLSAYTTFERKTFYKYDDILSKYFDEYNPISVLITHTQLHGEMPICLEAKKRDIPSIGLVRSWDNIFKGLRSRPEYLTVWNEINKIEAIEQEGYKEENIVITGAPQFDKYFQRHIDKLTKKEFCDLTGFDPSQKIILIATRGNFSRDLDETYLIDIILSYIDDGLISKNTQLIIRLHPWSQLEVFMKYDFNKNVYISFYDEFLPSLGWSMSSNQVIEVRDMLMHCDIVITPGSTIALEGAIFDKPTLVPMFHSYQPERASVLFQKTSNYHFKRIIEKELIKISWEETEFLADIKNALNSSDWYSEERRQLLDDYIPLRDGLSTKRLTEAIEDISLNK